MKLEAIDPLNLGNICVATVCKVSQGRPPAPTRGPMWPRALTPLATVRGSLAQPLITDCAQSP